MAGGKTGDWAEAQGALRALRRDLRPIYEQVLLREALRYQTKIVDRIVKGGVRPALSPFTLALRRLPGRANKGGFSGTKALILRGNLVRSVKVLGPRGSWPKKVVFVGVNRKERAKKADNAWAGKLINVAQVHEFGSKPFFITVTPKMRRFWFFLWQQRVVSAPLKASTKQIGPIRIPPRPFIRPVFKSERRRSKQRMQDELEKRIGAVLRAHGAR